jgi:tyrosyl-tRNA synthetase
MKAMSELICRNLQEVLGRDVLDKIVEKRPLNIYWGTAPTNKIHLGYFVPILKIADFINAGCIVTILFADLHAYLDNMKSNLKQLELRTTYYKNMITQMLLILNVDITKIIFVTGMDFQLTKEYSFDVYRINSLISVVKAKHSGAEVVKSSDNPMMTGLLYPTLQALDEVHLKCDAQFGGIDQRKIFTLAREYLPKLDKNPFNLDLKYNKRIHLMNEMIPGIRINKLNNIPLVEQNEKTNDEDIDDVEQDIELKMSASNEKTKIDLLETPKNIKKKINSAYCVEGDIIDNSVLIILEKVIFRILENLHKPFIIERNEEFGGNKEYNNINEITNDFLELKLHPGDLKNGISSFLINFLQPIRNAFSEKDMINLINKSYN